MKITATIRRADGSVEYFEVSKSGALRELAAEMTYDFFDVVNLRDGFVMLVDDDGQLREPCPPVNQWATDKYLALCKPGTNWTIVGDVAVLRDGDLA